MPDPVSIPPKKREGETPDLTAIFAKAALGILNKAAKQWLLIAIGFVGLFVAARWVDKSGEAWAASTTEASRKATDEKVQSLSDRVSKHDARFDTIDATLIKTNLSLARIEGALGTQPKEKTP